MSYKRLPRPDPISENRNGSPKFVSADRTDGRCWAHCRRLNFFGKMFFRNRFVPSRQYWNEFSGLHMWGPQETPFMNDKIAPQYGRLRNLRYWKW